MASTHIRRVSVVYFDQRTQLPKAGRHPKASRHPKAGCSFEILLLFVLFVHECSCAWRKMFSEKNKIPNEQLAFGSHSQLLTNKLFSSYVLHEPLVHMMKKVLFSSFSNVFYCFRPCKRMLVHAFAGRNTQQGSNFCFLQPFILSDLNYCSMGDCLSLSGHGVPFMGSELLLLGWDVSTGSAR